MLSPGLLATGGQHLHAGWAVGGPVALFRQSCRVCRPPGTQGGHCFHGASQEAGGESRGPGGERQVRRWAQAAPPSGHPQLQEAVQVECALTFLCMVEGGSFSQHTLTLLDILSLLNLIYKRICIFEFAL